MTVGDLILSGCYLGSNVSYNVKKMVENDYLVPERSAHDRRSIRVRLSPKGLDLCAKLDAMHDRHLANLASSKVDGQALTDAGVNLRRLDRFWTQIVERGALRRAISQPH
jgi:DNA-binding MarR family transcriptional regulator